MQPRLATPLTGVPNGANQASLPWDPTFEYPVPLIVRNTFIELNARPPSFEEFLQERKVQSCPPAVEGENQPPAPPSTTVAAPVVAGAVNRSPACSSTLLASAGGQGPVVYLSHTSMQGAASNSPPPLGVGMAAEMHHQFAAATPSGAARTRHAAPTSSQMLAAHLAAPNHGTAWEACAPFVPGLIQPGLSPVPPWRQAGSRHHQQASQPSATLTAVDIGAASAEDISAVRFASRSIAGPMAPTNSVASAVADEPAESSSGEDSANEYHGCPSDSAVIGSPACPTAGSRGHSLRMCKPCAFVMKGCQSGVDCKFCHLCEVGEKKRRKKEKVVFRREVQKWRQQSGSPSSASVNANGWKLGGFW